MKSHIFLLLALATSGIALPLELSLEDPCKGKKEEEECKFVVSLSLGSSWSIFFLVFNYPIKGNIIN